MADAAYCFGTVLAVQLLQRLPSRRLLMVFAALFVAAPVPAAWAPTPGLFAGGHIVQGLATSLMLIGRSRPRTTKRRSTSSRSASRLPAASPPSSAPPTWSNTTSSISS